MLDISNFGINALQNKTIAVFGFGSQGLAQSSNLKDSGLDVIVGLPEASSNFAKVKESGFEVFEFKEASKRADVIILLIPDEAHAEVFETAIKPYFKEGGTLIVAHGFSFHFGFIKEYEKWNIGMVAPKAVGAAVRKNFLEGSGIFSLYSEFHKINESLETILLEIAKGIGSKKVFKTSFKTECETDLFGEQVVLTGGIISLFTKAFETLTEAGYNEEISFYECVRELKLIVDLIHEKGVLGMYNSISNTAKFGGFNTGDFLIDESVKTKMKEVLKNIQNGEFARNFVKASIKSEYKKEIETKYKAGKFAEAEHNILNLLKHAKN